MADRPAVEFSPRPEPLSIPIIRIPETVISDISSGTAEIGEIIRTQKPDLIVTLDRSGTLLWNNYSRPRLEKAGVRIPPTVSAGIGREISTRIIDEMGTSEEELFGSVDLQKKYLVFLSEDRDTKTAVSELARKIKGTGVREIKSVLCVDDTRNQGATLTFCAPWIIAEALREAGFDSLSPTDGQQLKSGYDIGKYGQPVVRMGGISLARQIISKNQWLGFIKNVNFPTVALRAIADKERVIMPAIDREIYELMKGSGGSSLLERYYKKEDVSSLGDKLWGSLRRLASE